LSNGRRQESSTESVKAGVLQDAPTLWADFRAVCVEVSTELVQPLAAPLLPLVERVPFLCTGNSARPEKSQ
jgi:hypothetical protein